MFNTLLRHSIGVVSALALLMHTLILGTFLYIGILLKVISPKRLSINTFDPIIVFIASTWVEGILWWVNWVYRPKWHIHNPNPIDKKNWYLLTANHQSWVDIFVLYQLFNQKAPFLKFFIKKELQYIPIVGQAWWALNFPFMSRYSKEFLRKYPEKAGDDIKETQKACEKFSLVPTSVMNFLEGTRYTPNKHKKQGSPYRHLLKPKAGGLAFTIQALGDKFSALSNATIVYPDHIPTFWDMMCGNIHHIYVEVSSTPIPHHFSQGNYLTDPALKQEVQDWVTQLWQQKDQDITRILQCHAQNLLATDKLSSY